jgi:hypothetical protein
MSSVKRFLTDEIQLRSVVDKRAKRMLAPGT